MLTRGRSLVRIFDPDWLDPAEFSAYGPRHRFDHHRGVQGALGSDRDRRIYYAADTLKGRLIEVFGDARLISVGSVGVAEARLPRRLRLLDLRGGQCAHMRISGGPDRRPRSATESAVGTLVLRTPEADRHVDGLLYLDAHNQDVAYALFERAEDAVEVTANLALADPLLRSQIQVIAEQCQLIVEPY